MTVQTVATVECLCQAVSISVEKISRVFDACHCRMCRKWGGGPLLTVECEGEVAISDEDSIGIFGSSNWAERGFCRQCGTHLFYRLKEQQQYFLPIGLFQESDEFVMGRQIFIEEQPSYYCFANETKKMTGEELFAEYTSK